MRGLLVFAGGSPIDRLTARWTEIAAAMLSSAHADVHYDSANYLSDLIYSGATKFVQEHAPDANASFAEENLRKFVAYEIQLGRRENSTAPPVGESTFFNAKFSLCPLWPFC